MSRVDRNILRLAVYELLHCKDIPPKVTLNEAIDLGKDYGSENSGSFINGILDALYAKLRITDERVACGRTRRRRSLTVLGKAGQNDFDEYGADMNRKYEPRKIEEKWQARWAEEDVFKVGEDLSRPKYYVLEMFPYPSASSTWAMSAITPSATLLPGTRG